MTSKQVIITYEFEHITLNKSDFDYLEEKKLLGRNTKNERYFRFSGVFTTRDKLIVALPWAIKGVTDKSPIVSTSQSFDESSYLLETFFMLKEITNQTVPASLQIESGRDFINYCYLSKLRKLLESCLRENVFRTASEVLTSIRGKWALQTDVTKTEYPILFTCQFEDCDRNHPILALSHWYSARIGASSSSRRLRREANSLCSQLAMISDCPRDIQSVIRASMTLATRDKRFRNWVPLIQLIQAEAINENQVVGEVGDVTFPTARFFEIVVYKALVLLGCDVQPQMQTKLFGGAFWSDVSGNGTQDNQDESKRAQASSRPDLIVKRDGASPLLVECKYKDLELAVADNSVPYIIGFDRNDRNQILSFFLSISKGNFFNTKSVFVFYPTTSVENLDHNPELRSSCVIDVAEAETNLTWKAKGSSLNSNVRIKFIAIDIAALIKDIFSSNDTRPALDRIGSIVNSALAKAA